MKDHPDKPTAEQCEKGERLLDFEGDKAFACWYPQMGGYVAMCVVTFRDDGCFEAYVWHDGDFPFHGRDDPAHLHHCMAEQFMRFGNFVRKVQRADDRQLRQEGR